MPKCTTDECSNEAELFSNYCAEHQPQGSGTVLRSARQWIDSAARPYEEASASLREDEASDAGEEPAEEGAPEARSD